MTPDPTAPTVVAKPEPAKENWTYLGVRYSTSERKLYHAFLDSKDVERWYSSNLGVRTVGGVYTFEVTRDGAMVSVALHRFTYVMTSSDERRSEWVARHTADQTLYDSYRREKNAKNELRDWTILDVRKQWRKLPTPQRRALLASVIELITAGDVL